MDSLPFRHEVFNHIQSKFRKWERLEKTKALSASIKTPRELKQKTVIVNSFLKSNGYKTSSKERKPKANCEVKGERETSNILLLLQASLSTRSPLTVINKGNSDPFNALAVPINAQENSILSFYRDYMLPTAFHLTHKSKWSLASVRAIADWTICVLGLEGAGTAYAFIGSNASLAGQCADSAVLHKESLVCRTKSTAALREKLSHISDISRPKLFWHIYMLWTAEIAAENWVAAQLHGKMLKTFVDEYLQSGGDLYHNLEGMPVSMIELLFYFLYADFNMSTQRLVPPAFDVYEWLPNTLAAFLAAVQPLLPPAPVPPDSWHLDPTIDSEEMISCISMCRDHFLRIRRRWSDDAPERVAKLRYSWGQVIVAVGMGKLVCRYCRFKELSELASESSDYNYAQQYLALGAIKWIRSMQYEARVCGKNVREAKVRDALRPVLEKSEMPKLSSKWHEWKNARLWALYVGARDEENNPPLNGLSDYWFHKQFARQVKDMNLLSWEEIVHVLEGFLFDNSAYQQEGVWFANLMSLSNVVLE